MIRNILFDLDGTLTDPAEGIINSFLHAIKKLDLKEEDPTSMHTLIGPSLKDSFCGRYGLSEKEASRAIVVFREYFSAKGMYENKVYRDIPEILDRLKKEDRRLFIATSKMGRFARMITDHFKLSHHFTGIEGSLPDNTRTDKAEVIGQLLRAYGLDAKECLMVGDRKMDVEGALAHGIPAIGVTYGYGSRKELLDAGAAVLADSPVALFHQIRNWPAEAPPV